MTEEDEPKLPAVPEPVLEPSYLPPNPSVGELVTEIDRARHDAAHTVAALVEKLDVKARVRDETRSKLVDLRQRVDAAPQPVGKALDYAKRIPVPARYAIAAAVLLLLLLRRRRR
jgi:thioredoxin-like negative regulator of GroEL